MGLLDKRFVSDVKRSVSNFKFRPVGNDRADKRINILNKMLEYQISRM